MSISGNIAETGLTSILQTMSGTSGRGMLTVWRGDAVAHIGIESGYVASASLEGGEGFAQLLIAEGSLLPGQEVDVVRVQRRKRQYQPLGLLLVEFGLACREAVERSLETHVKRVLMEVMSWQNGAFKYVPMKAAAGRERPALLPEGLRIDALLLGLMVHLTEQDADKEMAAARADEGLNAEVAS